jgi:hypothetical protein
MMWLKDFRDSPRPKGLGPLATRTDGDGGRPGLYMWLGRAAFLCVASARQYNERKHP